MILLYPEGSAVVINSRKLRVTVATFVASYGLEFPPMTGDVREQEDS
jgi:hypothetical protein